MGYYFDDCESIRNVNNGNEACTLEVIAGRYIGENPPLPYRARPFTTVGVVRNKNYRYELDGNKLFPEAENGSYVYAWGKIHRSAEGVLRFSLIPYGPVKIWMNAAQVYATDFLAERFEGVPVTIDLPVRCGWNHIVLRFTKTRAGFGAEFGTWLGKLDYYFMHGLLPHEQMEGFDITPPTKEHFCVFPPEEEAMTLDGFAGKMLPVPCWSDGEKKLGTIARIFKDCAHLEGKKIVARSKFFTFQKCQVQIRVLFAAHFAVYVDEVLLDTDALFSAGAGYHQLAVILTVPLDYRACSPLDFSCDVSTLSGGNIETENPLIAGYKAHRWIFAGPFSKTEESALAKFDRELLVGETEERTWWRLDMPGGYVRLYNENALFGHWDYPLGVTLYGLLEAARALSKKHIAEYVASHVRSSVRTFDYALFDRDNFGGATAVHHLLSSIDSLDDCGSFCSLLLEAAKDGASEKLGDWQPIADYVGDYILCKQARLSDGSFFRKHMMHSLHNGTMWADDLYMSVPFLCRYAALKGDMSILDDAVRQFAGFKKRLYMSDKRLMAHVYDFKRNMNTGVPWGRGNGWTMFSLSELLMALPHDHAGREGVLEFFRELAAGCMAVQGADGWYHQVLDMEESYPESSCTAMFICAFSRGVRHGWFLSDAERYRKSCFKAWEALERGAIDRHGNLYGVCRGSEFAFNPRYYSEHLLPQLNNTHGIGIVLLAGAEIIKLKKQS